VVQQREKPQRDQRQGFSNLCRWATGRRGDLSMTTVNEDIGTRKHARWQGKANHTNGDASPGSAAHNGTSHANDRHGYVFGNVPLGLKDVPQWGVWRREYQNGKPNNVPYDAKTGNHLSVSDPQRWSPYEVALNIYLRGTRGQWDGISFVLKALGGIVGLDIDDCVDENGDLTPEAQAIANLWGSYLEYSPNRRGIRGFAYGTLPVGRRRVGNLEIFDGAKALTVTGWNLVGTPTILEERTEAIHEIHKKFFTKPVKQHPKGTFNPDDFEPLDDDEVIDAMLRAKNGAQIQALMNGDFSHYYSASEADLAACNYLAFYCGPNSHEQIDQIFRTSFAFFRSDKWDTRHYGNGDTYGQHTIKIALEGRTEFYARRRSQYGNGSGHAHLPQAASDTGKDTESEKTRRDHLPEIIVNNRPLRDMTKESLNALEKKNSPPVTFVRDGSLVRVQHNEKGQAGIAPLNDHAVRGLLTRSAEFLKKTYSAKNGWGSTHISPPLDIVHDIMALGAWDNIPPLEAVMETPILRDDGSLLECVGYDATTRLYYSPAPGLVVPSVPAHPTPADVADARAFLETELLGDFPFCGPADKANTVGTLLTPVVRQTFCDVSPLGLFDKPQGGTGASLLVDLLGLIHVGEYRAFMGAPTEEEEWRKQISTVLSTGATFIGIDNVEHALGAPALERALTSTTWTDRALGTNTQLRLPQRATWVATGNNIRLRRSMQRRSYWIRMDAKMARPWERAQWSEPRR
jgi:primase-polymerase (primpol)-like protein